MSVTREKILELGENLIRTKGYNAFSYQDISTELGIKNAAIHYYFPSKENLGTSIVKTNIQRFEEMVENMNSRKFGEWQQLEIFLKIYIKSHRENKKCIVGALSPDYFTLNETTKRDLKRMVEMILAWLTDLLDKGRSKKIFSFNNDPESKATIIFSSLVASLQLSAVLDKIDYKGFYQSILDDLKP
ncbi:HTH-type transcriptional repressor NemR [bioreactor metagenome]|uniref:HTH-type transcriptional repressor NemR n=1 Tax=bioreactor metagenome TaxID=1076179 RepID=A0A645FWN3_9ZZZZ